MTTIAPKQNNNLSEFERLGNIFDSQMSAMYRNTQMNQFYAKEKNRHNSNINRQNTNINWSTSYNTPPQMSNLPQISVPRCSSLGVIPF
ncbi:hypothetical protein CPAV1605_926 [seawater metagenome]|uniref:Uncharacterized protein n=1 Tax=seawater metagenome TaxID=1561972 RepID=A0A5E8CIZ0_9ZZZZ